MRFRSAAILGIAAACLSLTGRDRVAMASRGGPSPLSSEQLSRMRDVRAMAKRSSPEKAEPLWFELGRSALYGLDPEIPGRANRKFLEASLEEASRALPVSSLAALAAVRWNPIVSRAFEEHLLKEAKGLNRSAIMMEAAADCRDASARQRDLDSTPFECADGITGPAGWAAGGSSRSVYRVAILAAQDADSSYEASSFMLGMKRGLATVPSVGERMIVEFHEAPPDPAWMSSWFEAQFQGPCGILVAPADEVATAIALAAARVGRMLAIDARAASHVPVSSPGDRLVPAKGFDAPGPLTFRFPFPWVDSTLTDVGFNIDVSDGPRPWEISIAPMTTRPPEWERARRLAEVVRDQPGLKRIAIALPETGGNPQLARAFSKAMEALKREVVVARYTSGRRDYLPEVRALVGKGAQAVLLAGPTDESGEWLRAMMKAGVRIPVLAGIDLDPAEFHDVERAALDGATLVADEWSDRDSATTRAIEAEFGSSGARDRPAFERGYRLGGPLARAIDGGAITPARLTDALTRKEPMVLPAAYRYFTGALPAGDRIGPGVEVPLYRVRQGAMVRLGP